MNTIRIFWPAGTVPDKGGFLNPKFSSEPGFRVVWPPITSSSIVLISPCEYRPDDVPRFTPVLQRFVGDAVISVNGIAPSDGEKPGDSGYVDFDIEARHHDGSPWGDPLDIMVLSAGGQRHIFLSLGLGHSVPRLQRREDNRLRNWRRSNQLWGQV